MKINIYARISVKIYQCEAASTGTRSGASAAACIAHCALEARVFVNGPAVLSLTREINQDPRTGIIYINKAMTLARTSQTGSGNRHEFVARPRAAEGSIL